MSDRNPGSWGAFWTSLPGILTALTSLLVALGGAWVTWFAPEPATPPPPEPDPPGVSLELPDVSRDLPEVSLDPPGVSSVCIGGCTGPMGECGRVELVLGCRTETDDISDCFGRPATAETALAGQHILRRLRPEVAPEAAATWRCVELQEESFADCPNGCVLSKPGEREKCGAVNLSLGCGSELKFDGCRNEGEARRTPRPDHVTWKELKTQNQRNGTTPGVSWECVSREPTWAETAPVE